MLKKNNRQTKKNDGVIFFHCHIKHEKKRQYVFVIRSIHLSNQDCHIIESIFFVLFCSCFIRKNKSKTNKQTMMLMVVVVVILCLLVWLKFVCQKQSKKKEKPSGCCMWCFFSFLFRSFQLMDQKHKPIIRIENNSWNFFSPFLNSHNYIIIIIIIKNSINWANWAIHSWYICVCVCGFFSVFVPLWIFFSSVIKLKFIISNYIQEYIMMITPKESYFISRQKFQIQFWESGLIIIKKMWNKKKPHHTYWRTMEFFSFYHHQYHYSLLDMNGPFFWWTQYKNKW